MQTLQRGKETEANLKLDRKCYYDVITANDNRNPFTCRGLKGTVAQTACLNQCFEWGEKMVLKHLHLLNTSTA